MAYELGEPTQQLTVDRDRLRRHMRDLLAYARETHAPLCSSIPIWWKWYRAESAHPEKNTPFQGASNLVYPLIRTHADQIHAQRFQALSPAPDRFWTPKTHNEAPIAQALSKEVVNLINDDASSRVFDLSGALYDGLRDSGVLGEGILRLRYAPRERWRFGPPRGRDASGRTRPPTLRKIRVAEGPIVEMVPRDRVAWQPGVRIEDSEWVVREVPLTRQEILRAVEAHGWDAETAKTVLANPPLTASLGGLAGWAGSSTTSAASSSLFAPYALYEILVEFPMTSGIQPSDSPDDPKTKLYPPILVWADAEGRILYCGTYPYPTRSWNYYQLTLSGMGGGNHDAGLSEALEHFQRGVTTMLNQGIDAVHLHNAILFVTTDPKLIGKPFVPGQGFKVDDLSQINFDMRPPNFVQPNIQMIQTMFAGAERLTGISDPGFGRESRLGGHPSPATNLLAMLRQGSLKLAATLQRDRVALSRLGQDIAALYQAYGLGDPIRLTRRYGEEDAQKLLLWASPTAPIQELPDFDVRALDESLNPETEFQKQVMVDQLAASYIARVLQLLQNIPPAAQQNPMLVAPLAQAVQIFTESYRRVLEAAQIDDPDTFLLRVQGLTEGTSGAISRMGEAATSALAGLSAANPNGIIPAMPAGVPDQGNGAAYAAGAPVQ